MASEKLFQQYPSFPEDINCLEIPKISLEKLLSGDQTQADELFHICCDVGFFLLDLKGEENGHSLLQDIESCFGLTKDVFDLEVEEKTKFSQDASNGDFTRWKQVGIMKTDKQGTPDRCEFYALSQDEMLGNTALNPHPQPIKSRRSRIGSLMKKIHSIISLILSVLDTHLGLENGTLVSHLRTDSPSGTLLRLIRYSPQPAGDRRTSLLGHTDLGAITFLCTALGGLQVLPPQGDPANDAEWRYLKPQPNCAIINIGDTLVEWSGGILRSSMHRVTYAPGKQATCTRYSMAYLLRANKTANMKRLESDRIPSAEEDGEVDLDLSCQEWELKKTRALTAGADCARSSGGRRMRHSTDAIKV